MTKHITITLTQDQAFQIVRILDYGKADPETRWVNGEYKPTYSPEDKKFNAFIQRIQNKINAELVKL